MIKKKILENRISDFLEIEPIKFSELKYLNSEISISERSLDLISNLIHNQINNIDTNYTILINNVDAKLLEVEEEGVYYKTILKKNGDSFKMLDLIIDKNNKLKSNKGNLMKFAMLTSKFMDKYNLDSHGHNLRVGFGTGRLYHMLLESSLNNESSIGKRLKLEIEKNSDTYLDYNTIIYSALVHDVGKLFVSDEILKKSSKLTENEFNQIKKHTQYGNLCMRGIQELEFASQISAYHHENWNGQGYFGLKETQIPFIARLTKIVDVYDALRSQRSYKRSFNIDETYSIMRGSHPKFDSKQGFADGEFDPELLSFFLDENNFSKFSPYHDSLIKKFK